MKKKWAGYTGFDTGSEILPLSQEEIINDLRLQILIIKSFEVTIRKHKKIEDMQKKIESIQDHIDLIK